MFDSSISDNITLYEKFDSCQLGQAIKLSGLEEFVKTLDAKENSLVGENGCNLSGGEKQRVAIARALIKNTPILVLDEATSALDNETASSIEKSILNLIDLTCVVVTHKLSKELLKRYDGIIAMKGGKIVEQGSFDQLIDSKGYFYSMYSMQ
jgi:ATP-binding cassette subfamily C protein